MNICSYLIGDEDAITTNHHILNRITRYTSLGLDVRSSLESDKVSVQVHNKQCLSIFYYLHIVEHAGGEGHHACQRQVTGRDFDLILQIHDYKTSAKVCIGTSLVSESFSSPER